MPERSAARIERSKSSTTAAPRFTVGERQHAAEAEAERAAVSVMSRSSGASPSIGHRAESSSGVGTSAPASVQATLSASGQPLDPSVRSTMERRFAHRFSDVRVHRDSSAASSANDLDANAYTVGRHIVFGAGRYEPGSNRGQALLAHELAHVVQSSGIREPSVIRRQQKTDTPTVTQQTTQNSAVQNAGANNAQVGAAAATTPRRDFVFIMGADKKGTNNPFYDLAEKYFRAHIPGATFNTSTRNLADLLSWISTNVHDPIGNIYIVSHANEDGTLSFALDSADPDAKISVAELREAVHPSGGAASSLADVSKQIDAATKIHVKGCDIGRTQEMVELLDEAFGGFGTVTAPTHEQVYGTDPQLEKEARAKFKADVESNHPMPAPVDPSLKGADKRKAAADRRKDLAARAADIKAEMTARKAEGDALAEEANTFEALSGPMFQRPGTKLFTKAEIQPEVNRLYSHLSEVQRKALVTGLVAPDNRSASTAEANGTFQQHGQRVYKKKTFTNKVEEPHTAAEANAVYAADFKQAHFRATGTPVITKTPATGGFTISVDVPGKVTPPGGSAEDATQTESSIDVIPDDAALIEQGKTKVSNPDRYAWRVASTHARGVTTRTVIGERVVAYLHHQSLDASPHEHFDKPESDPRFFATSTFTPPAAGPGAAAGAAVPTVRVPRPVLVP